MYEQTLTKKDLKARGWTDAGIAKFLGEPDETRVNPHYPTAPAMCLYYVDRVEAIENSDAYATWRAEAAKHRAAGKQAAKTRAVNHHDMLHTPAITEEELDKLFDKI